MARAFDNSNKVTENVISPGPASKPIKYGNNSLNGPATTEYKEFNTPQSPSQNMLGGEDLNERVLQIRQDDIDGEKSPSIGVQDIDEAISYYFNNVLNPTVIENGVVEKVPTLYGSPERWSAMTNFGFYRDNKGKIILPLIMYRHTTIAKNENIQFPRLEELVYVSKLRWDSKNKYDGKNSKYMQRSAATTDRYSLTMLPNYVMITYECVIWTSFLEQMNKIIEKIQFSDTTYWGDKNRFKFRTSIDSIDTAVELSADTERAVKSTFSITIYGYILTEDFNNKKTTKISLSPKKVTFTENV